MRLSAYLAKKSLTLEEFSRQSGISKATISRIARGVNRPDWETMEAIKCATGGAVLPNDFTDDARPCDTEPEAAA